MLDNCPFLDRQLQIKNKVSSRSNGEDIWNSSELGQSFAGRSERLVCQSVLVIRAEHIMDYLLLVKAMGTMVTSIQSWYVLGEEACTATSLV